MFPGIQHFQRIGLRSDLAVELSAVEEVAGCVIELWLMILRDAYSILSPERSIIEPKAYKSINRLLQSENKFVLGTSWGQFVSRPRTPYVVKHRIQDLLYLFSPHSLGVCKQGTLGGEPECTCSFHAISRGTSPWRLPAGASW